MRPRVERTSDAGVARDGGSPNARRAASALSAPTARKTISRASESIGMVIVTRSTHGGSPAGTATARASSSSSDGAPGKSDAV